MQQSGQDAEDVGDFLLGEEEDFHRRPDFGEFIGVIPTLTRRAITLHARG